MELVFATVICQLIVNSHMYRIVSARSFIKISPFGLIILQLVLLITVYLSTTRTPREITFSTDIVQWKIKRKMFKIPLKTLTFSIFLSCFQFALIIHRTTFKQYVPPAKHFTYTTFARRSFKQTYTCVWKTPITASIFSLAYSSSRPNKRNKLINTDEKVKRKN